MTEGRPLRSTRRLSNRAWDRPRWYSISNSAASAPVQVTIYDEIGFFGVTAGEFLADLAGISGDIEMHINSPGGDIYEGLTIYNRLKQRSGTIHVVVDGLAASAASFIAMAASPGMLEMAPRSELMIHNGFTMAIGDANDLRKAADLVERKTADIADIYAERSGKPAAYWLAKMGDETWLSAKDAVAEGLADKITGQDAPQNSWDLSVFARYSNAAPVHEPFTGTHSHKGPGDQDEREHSHDGDASHKGVYDPDHDGDDDSTAEGDTDHDYVLPDGSPGPKAQWYAHFTPQNADKYKQADRDRMAKSGEAMEDGSYPVADAEDLDKAIHAVGRGGADHDAIRAHIIKRADALGLSSQIPDNWNSDGSLKSEPDNLFDPGALAALLTTLEGVNQ